MDKYKTYSESQDLSEHKLDHEYFKGEKKSWLIFSFLAALSFAVIVYFMIVSAFSVSNGLAINLASSLSAVSLYVIFMKLGVKYNLYTNDHKEYASQQSLEQMSHYIQKANEDSLRCLRSILSSCDALQPTVSPTSEQMKVTQSIFKSSYEIESMINEMNTYLVLEVDHVDNEKNETILRKEVRSVLECYYMREKLNNINLTYYIHNTIPSEFTCDPFLLKTLINNAVHVVSHNSGLDKIHCELLAKEEGMKEENLRIIVLAHDYNKAKDSVNNNNISMSIITKITKILQGHVSRHKRENGDFELRIDIPVFEKTDQIKSDKNQELNALEGQDSRLEELSGNSYSSGKHMLSEYYKDALNSALIVDDHPANLLLLNKFTHKIGCENIEKAINGIEALDMYKKTFPDLVLMDCQMPEMDGYSATTEIRKLERSLHLKPSIIIGVTADKTLSVRKKCIESGMNDVIYKPIDTNMLATVIRHYFFVNPANMKQYQKEDVAAFKQETETLASESKFDFNETLKQRPVNLDHLRSYTDGDTLEEQIFFRTFIDQARETLDKLEETLQTHNDKDWRRAAHKLKGSSANLGAEQLAELCHIAELHDGTVSDEDILSAIRAELTKVSSFLSDVLHAPPGDASVH